MITLRLKAILAAVALLLTGVAIGCALTVHYELRIVRRIVAARPGQPAPIDNAMAHLEGDWVSALHLDAAQTAHVHAELVRSGAELKDFRAATLRQLQQLLNDMVVRSATTLTPSQREALYRRAERRFSLFGLHFTPLQIPPPRAGG